MKALAAALLFMLLLVQPGAAAAPSTIRPAEFGDFAFRQNLGAKLPLDAVLRGKGGKPVTLGSLFDGRPIVIDFEYDRCTVLCGTMLDRVSAAMAPLTGARLVAIDIDPAATPEAAEKFAAAHGATTVLTGDEPTIRRIADAAGFPYRRDPTTGDYAHPAGFLVAAPDGTIARYFLGFDWRRLDLRLGVAEAAGHRIAAPAEQILLFCYCYDPQTGHYDLAVSRLLAAVGAATLLALAGTVGLAVRRAAR
ncbi:MAG TPA: SCO family protein [Stellaceae bacterium]